MLTENKTENIQDQGDIDRQMEPGLTDQCFRKIAPNGFGDLFNAYPHSMLWHDDYLYVGTTRANLSARGVQIKSKTPERLGVWPVRIPENFLTRDACAQIWRYHPPSDKWEMVYDSQMEKGIEDKDVPVSIGFRCMTWYKGTSDSAPALYVPTWGTYFFPKTYMLRSSDGSNFEVVSEIGSGIPGFKPWGLRGLVSFKGRLFTSPAAGVRHEPNLAGYMVILVSSDPARGDWRLACEPHFGDPNNSSVFHMAEFNGYLYAGTLNINEGFQIWKTDAEGEPPFKWQKVLSHGAYRGKLNQMAMTLVTFDNFLYVGGGLQNGGFDFDNFLGPAAPELIRIRPDDSWDLIMGEPRVTPDGVKIPLSGLAPGFGNPFAGYLWSMCVHAGWLYAGTAVWAAFLRYMGREERWPKFVRNIFSPDIIEKTLKEFGGCDLWRSRDGVRWMPVTQNGFDNCFNLGFRSMASTRYGLFVGAANPFAPEIAVKRVAGWTYEMNFRGGLEIWLGRNRAQQEVSKADTREISERPGPQYHLSTPVKTDINFIEHIVNEFFVWSGFRHFGFWRFGMNDAASACENLMAEIMAFVPEKKGSVADLGCGYGATTKYLLKYYPGDAVTGITGVREHLELCRERAAEANFLYSKLTRLKKVPAGSFSLVIWVKGHEKLGPRRKLLSEAFSILKDGGRLVLFDVVRADESRSWNRFVDSPVRTPDEYKALVSAAGFKDVCLFDVTAESFGGFRKHLGRYLGREKLAEKIDDETCMKLESCLLPEGLQDIKCILVSASKI